MTDSDNNKKPEQPPQSVGPLDAMISVFRAWFGVQSEKNRQRDFNSNDPTPFIVGGIIFTVIMIVGVIIAVHIALSSAGK